jgi:predicted metal-dependent hydrolase
MHPAAQQGFLAFNNHKFYEAHECFENAWRKTEDDSREFYRALLQLSGGFFRLTLGRPEAARKFFSRSLHWLGFFPDRYQSVDTAELRKQLANMIEAIEKGRCKLNLIEDFFPTIQLIFEERIQ